MLEHTFSSSRKHPGLLAGQEIHLPVYIPRLTATDASPGQAQILPGRFQAGKLVFDSKGWVAGDWRQVKCWSTNAGYHISVDDHSEYIIDGDGKVIQHIKRGKDQNPPDNFDRDVLHGPVLVLALALQGIWCLHASAVMLNGRVTLFLADSGRGKSTLAAYLARQASSYWQLVADDILPVSVGEGSIEARPFFPQLKLSEKAQPGFQLPDCLPVQQIFVLNQAGQDAGVQARALSPRQAVQELLRHTAGTRLYAPDLLARHLVFCGETARTVPVYHLVYPHRGDTLLQVQKILETVC